MGQSQREREAVAARFQSRYDVRALIDVVVAVARDASTDAPARVTQRQWDAARAQAGYPDAPTARQIATRLKMAWADVLALALDGRDADKSLGYRFGQDADAYLDADDVRAALGTVALRLGKRTLSRADYSDERVRMLAAARRRWLHRSELCLPTVDQVQSG